MATPATPFESGGSSGSSRSCAACAKSKRKCGRQTPTCARCRARRVSCAYPVPKPTCWVVASPYPPSPTAPTPSTSTSISTPLFYSFEVPVPPPCYPLTDYQLELPWFLTPQTWTTHPIPHEDLERLRSTNNSSIKRTIGQVQRIISSWATTGSTPFIHQRLYRERMPLCVGDAFTSLATYVLQSQVPTQGKGGVHRAALEGSCEGGRGGEQNAARDMLLRLIGNRILQTVEGHGQANNGGGGRGLDAFTHIARVHALLVLVTIGLFDGDVRLRHIAERHLSTLAEWSRAMLESVGRAATTGELIFGSLLDDPEDGSSSSNSEQLVFPANTKTQTPADGLWTAFILSETARRTYLVVDAICGGYQTLLDGQLHCGGGLHLTTRAGVWDAGSAWAWTKLCAEMDVGFMEHGETGRLFGERRPEEVDSFGRMVMEATYGRERMESWVGGFGYST